jgi:hypothetical protein
MEVGGDLRVELPFIRDKAHSATTDLMKPRRTLFVD